MPMWSYAFDIVKFCAIAQSEVKFAEKHLRSKLHYEVTSLPQATSLACKGKLSSIPRWNCINFTGGLWCGWLRLVLHHSRYLPCYFCKSSIKLTVQWQIPKRIYNEVIRKRFCICPDDILLKKYWSVFTNAEFCHPMACVIPARQAFLYT